MRPMNAPEWPFVGEIHRVDDTYWRFLKTTGWTEFVPTDLERAQHAITEAAEEAAHHDRMCELISMGITARSRHDYTNTVEREMDGYHVRLQIRSPGGFIGCDHFIADAHLEAALVTPLLFNAYMDSWVRSMLKVIAEEVEGDSPYSTETMEARIRAMNDMSRSIGISSKDAAAKFAEFTRQFLADPQMQKSRKI